MKLCYLSNPLLILCVFIILTLIKPIMKGLKCFQMMYFSVIVFTKTAEFTRHVTRSLVNRSAILQSHFSISHVVFEINKFIESNCDLSYSLIINHPAFSIENAPLTRNQLNNGVLNLFCHFQQ